MHDWLPVAAGERLLFLEVPEREALAELSARIGHGVIVCLGARDEIAEARRAAADLENVMFTPGTADEIPWQDGFFSQLVCSGRELTPLVCREVARALAGGGKAWLAEADGACLTEAGLVEGGDAGKFRCFVKPEEPSREKANGLQVIL